MAFNKFMHPRNRYKDNKPNFDELAEKYPEFARHVIRNQAGKATLDFHDSESLRSLTCTLLKEDFGLEVELPLDRLIPTLSLRLNYIHWIEDLLASTGHGKETVWGIDTGCGASCIYPLLGAQMNGWNFLASEVDALAIYYAKENITRNKLDDKITVVETLEDSMFEQALNSAPSRQPLYHFTMCNPPFFGNSLEAQGIMTSRSMSRPEPKSVSTAAELEMISEGGEVEFVRRMIEESLRLRNQVVWYTSMLGKKSSLALVREELRKHKIRNVTHTEFCQGRTMRWGIAWTFKEDMESPLPACPKRKLAEKNVPFTITVPDTYIKRVLEPGLSGGLQNRIQSVAKAVHTMMQELEMSVNRKPSSKWCPKFVLTASRNTWSYQRRKRRREKLIQRKSSVCPKATVHTPSPGESASSSSAAAASAAAAVPSSSKVMAGEERLGQDPPSCKDTLPSSCENDGRIQRVTSDLPGVVPSSSSSPRASTTATSEDGRILKKARLDTSYPPGVPSTSTATRSEKLPTPAPTLSSNISKASSKTIVESTCLLHEDTFATVSGHESAVGRLGDAIEAPASSLGKKSYLGDDITSRQPPEAGQTMTDGTRYKDQHKNSHKDTFATASHDSAVGKLGDAIEAPASSQGKTDRSRQPPEAGGVMTDCTGYKDQSSSSDEADDGFPLDINLDIKLCDRRTIVIVASVADSSKKNLLYQVVQYIKNQMK